METLYDSLKIYLLTAWSSHADGEEAQGSRTSAGDEEAGVAVTRHLGMRQLFKAATT